MTLDKIRERRAELREIIADHQTQIDIASAEIKAMQRRCDHPNMRKYSAMGEIGSICDDRGYQT